MSLHFSGYNVCFSRFYYPGGINIQKALKMKIIIINHIIITIV